jgi:hypothetical protein
MGLGEAGLKNLPCDLTFNLYTRTFRDMATKKPAMTGSFRGPMENVAAAMIAGMTTTAAACGSPEARQKFIRLSLDDIRTVYADDPSFVSLIFIGLLEHAERRGLLSAA